MKMIMMKIKLEDKKRSPHIMDICEWKHLQLSSFPSLYIDFITDLEDEEFAPRFF